jgi:hypothetical protein
MARTASPKLWMKPRPASNLMGVEYRTVIRLAESGAIPSKSYVVRGQRRFLISVAWLLSKGGVAV